MDNSTSEKLSSLINNSPNYRADLYNFLINIPKEEESALKISEIAHKAKIDLHSDAIEVAVILLKVFNVLEIFDEGKTEKIRIKNEIADLFVRSFSQFIRDNFVLISNWERTGISKQVALTNVFTWGVQFLYEMEHIRTSQDSESLPLRKSKVVQAVIKANVIGYKSPMYLFQYDSKAQQFQMIGGKNNIDETIVQTLHRKVQEELSLNNFDFNKDVEFKKVEGEFSSFQISPTFGAFSEYSFEIFQAKFNREDIKFSNIDRWVSIEEIVNGITSDGIRITIFKDKSKEERKKIIDIFEKLPLSFTEQKNQIKNQNLGSVKSKTSSKLLEELIQEGESETLEFKSTLRWDVVNKKLNKDLEKVIVKTFCGFLNSKGGKLVIGLDDDGEVIGIENDMQTLQKKNIDGFTQIIIQLISSYFGVEYCAYVNIAFEKMNDLTVCICHIEKSPSPVFMKQNENREFFVRAGNTTKSLNIEEVYKYISINW